jgi:hypothetical protein
VNADDLSPLSFYRAFLTAADKVSLLHGLQPFTTPSEIATAEDRIGLVPPIVDRLAGHLKPMGRELVILIDEIHMPFIDETASASDKELLRRTLRELVAAPDSNVRLIVTGSRMVTGLLHISMGAPEAITRINIDRVPHTAAQNQAMTDAAVATSCADLSSEKVAAAFAEMAKCRDIVGSDIPGLSTRQRVRIAAALVALKLMIHYDHSARCAAGSVGRSLFGIALNDMDSAITLLSEAPFNSDATTLPLLARLAYGRLSHDELDAPECKVLRYYFEHICIGRKSGEPGSHVQLVPPYGPMLRRRLAPDGEPVPCRREGWLEIALNWRLD